MPVATLNRIVEFLITDGHVKRGYLGIKTQGVRLPEDQASAHKQETGLLLVGVESSSPAAESGLLLGDIIVSFDGQPDGKPECESLTELAGGNRSISLARVSSIALHISQASVRPA